MGRADLHIHTVYSWDGTCSIPAVLKQAASQAHLDVIAITDHDEIVGALQAVELAPVYGINVIPGSEISTSEGHLIALFIREKIPAGLPLIDTVMRVGEKGGLCIAAHPTTRGASSLSKETICKALHEPEVRGVLVGIEIFNAGLIFKGGNANAQLLAHSLPLAYVGSSDSHLLWTIGRGFTSFRGSTAAELRKALEERSTQVTIGKEVPAVSHILGWLRGILLRKAGWIECNYHPQEPVMLGRISSTLLAAIP